VLILLRSYQRSFWQTFFRLINLDHDVLTYQSWIGLWPLNLFIFDCGIYPFDWVFIKEGHLCGESSFTYHCAKLWHIPSLSFSAFVTFILIVLYKIFKFKKDHHLSD